MKKIFLIITLLIFSICCFAQSRNISETTKKVVYERDAGKFQCCGSSYNLEYDHSTPYSCGGSNDAFRIREGNYCIICEIEDNIVTVIVTNIGHRKGNFK